MERSSAPTSSSALNNEPDHTRTNRQVALFVTWLALGLPFTSFRSESGLPPLIYACSSASTIFSHQDKFSCLPESLAPQRDSQQSLAPRTIPQILHVHLLGPRCRQRNAKYPVAVIQVLLARTRRKHRLPHSNEQRDRRPQIQQILHKHKFHLPHLRVDQVGGRTR